MLGLFQFLFCDDPSLTIFHVNLQLQWGVIDVVKVGRWDALRHP